MNTIVKWMVLLAMAVAAVALAPEARAQRQCETCASEFEACVSACDANTRTGARCAKACEREYQQCTGRLDCSGGGDTGGGGDSCPVVTGVFDLDVPTVQVSGEFTVNGATPLPYDAHQGRIELRSGTLGTVDLGSVHEGTYAAWIVPGTYDVHYLYEQGDVLPRNTDTRIMEGVALTSNEVFPIDVPAVLVMGDVLIDGAPAPASVYENGELRLRDQLTGASFPVGFSYDGAFMAMVVPGTYDVLWHRLLGGSQVPLNGEAVVAEDVVVAGLTEFDIDVPMVALSGSFTLNGGPPPHSVYENGEIRLRDTVTGDLVTLGQTRDGAWSANVVPGTYDVVYANLLGGDVVPANPLAVLQEGVALTADGTLDIDIPAVTLSGDFTLDGAPFPDGIYNHAHLWLQGPQADDRIDLGSSLDDSYVLRVVPGRYDVYYERALSTGLVPENAWALVKANAKVPMGNGTRTLDIDVVSGLAAVDLTVWGAPPPASVYENGAIDLVDPRGDRFELFQTRDGGGSARVVDGDYEMRYGRLLGDQVPRNQDAVVGAVSAQPLLIPAPVDLQPGGLAGGFSQAGAPFPGFDDGGRILLRDRDTGDPVEIGETTEGGYDVVLLGGTYDVVYDHLVGDAVAKNVGAELGCIVFEPPAPAPVLTPR